MRKFLSFLVVALFSTTMFATSYTVAGSSTALFGTSWDPTNTDNDMTLVEGTTYRWQKQGVALAEGAVQFKVTVDHSWDSAYPSDNYQLSISETASYNVVITFDSESHAVNATATKAGEAVVIQTINLHGNFSGAWANTDNFVVADGNATASLTLALTEGTYEFGVNVDGAWRANGTAFSRENPEAVIEAGSGNLTLAVDIDGDYTFVWTYATNTLSITFPANPCAFGSIEYLGNGSGVEAYTNRFKVCAPTASSIVNIQAPGWATAPGIYLTFPAAITACDLEEDEYDVQDAGILLHCDAFKAEKTQVTIIDGANTEHEVLVYRRPDGYIVGENAIFGSWSEKNGMPMFGKTVVALEAADYKLKVLEEMSWSSTKYGYDELANQTGFTTDNNKNIIFTLVEDAEVAFEIVNGKLAVTLPEEEEEELPVIKLAGTMTEPTWADGALTLTPAEDELTAAVTVTLAPGTYEFKMVVGDKWVSMNGEGETLYSFNRNWTAIDNIVEENLRNFELTADVAGDYVFTWTYATNGLAITFPESVDPEPEANYYLVGSMQDWLLERAIPMPGDSVVIVLEPNVYQFKVLPQKTSWDNELGYDDIDAECSSEGLEDGGNNNIKFTIAASCEIKVKVIEGELCITGDFGGEVVISTYTVVGDPDIIPAGWDVTSELTNMSLGEDNKWHLVLENVALKASHGYQWKVVGNHSWDVAQYPQSGDYYVNEAEAGIYTIEFVLDVEEGGSYLATKTGDAPEPVVAYYLVGSLNEWTVSDTYLFTPNLGSEVEEYQLNTTLAAEDELKVVKVVDGDTENMTYYPDGDNYIVDADLAGKVVIYFRPEYQEDWAAFGGYMYIAVDDETGVDNILGEGVTEKFIENGQLFIRANGKIYTVMGVVR